MPNLIEPKFIRKEIRKIQTEQNKFKLRLKNGEDTLEIRDKIINFQNSLDDLNEKYNNTVGLSLDRQILKNNRKLSEKTTKSKIYIRERKKDLILKIRRPDETYCPDGKIRTRKEAKIWLVSEGSVLIKDRTEQIKAKNKERTKRYNKATKTVNL